MIDGQGPVRCRYWPPWAGGPGSYKETDWAKRSKPVASALHGLQWWTVSEGDSALPKVLVTMVSVTVRAK